MNLKKNLINLGIAENKISLLESYISSKKRNTIIFPEVLARNVDISYQTSMKILLFLSKEKFIKRFYRIEIPEKNDHLDFNKIKEIPDEIELENCLITNVWDRTYVLFKV